MGVSFSILLRNVILFLISNKIGVYRKFHLRCSEKLRDWSQQICGVWLVGDERSHEEPWHGQLELGHNHGVGRRSGENLKRENRVPIDSLLLFLGELLRHLAGEGITFQLTAFPGTYSIMAQFICSHAIKLNMHTYKCTHTCTH